MQKEVDKSLTKEAQLQQKIEDMDSFIFPLAEEVRDANCKRRATHKHVKHFKQLTSLILSFDPQVGIIQLHNKLLFMGQPPDTILLNLVQSLLLLLAKNVKEALQFDEENGNTLWRDAILK